MKKSIYIVLFGLLLSMGVVSCDNNTDLLFDETASQRKEGANKAYNDALKSSEQGWLFQYFPEETQKYGGYNYVVKFNQHDSVTVWYEDMADFTKPETSLYDIISYGGPVLTFNTYNSLMHHFANPSASEYLAKGGDFEFLIMSNENDVITLKGIKTGNILRMTKLTESAETYLNKVKPAVKLLKWASLEGEVNGTEVSMKLNDHSLSIAYFENEEIKSEEAPFICTEKGIHFIKPLSILGITVDDLTLNASTKQLISANGEVKIDIKPLIASDDFISGKRLNKGNKVYYSSTNYSPSLKKLIETLKTADPDFKLLQFYINYDLGGGSILPQQLDFYRGQAPESGGRWIEYNYEFKAIGEDRVLIEFLYTGNGDYYSNAKSILSVFNGEFIVTPTDTGYILTKANDPNYWVEVQ